MNQRTDRQTKKDPPEAKGEEVNHVKPPPSIYIHVCPSVFVCLTCVCVFLGTGWGCSSRKMSVALF